jgi:hypothetical protein
MTSGASDVAEDPLDEGPKGVMRCMHVKVGLIDNIGDI